MRIAGCVIVLGMVFSHPQITADAASEALRIFGAEVFPVLYPYMVLTRLISSSSQRKGGTGMLTILLGLMGGSPSGASMLRFWSESKALDKRIAYTFCALTGTISPMFLLNTVGTWLGNPALTSFLVISHFLGAALSALSIYAFFPSEIPTTQIDSSSASDLRNTDIIASCVSSVLGIGGCIVFFSVCSAMVSLVIPDENEFLSACVHGLLEIAGGLKSLLGISTQPKHVTVILTAVFCGFSGISMLSQNALFLRPLGITMYQLIVIGIFRAMLCGLVMMLLTLLF